MGETEYLEPKKKEKRQNGKGKIRTEGQPRGRGGGEEGGGGLLTRLDCRVFRALFRKSIGYKLRRGKPKTTGKKKKRIK